MAALSSIGSLSETIHQNSLADPDEESYLSMLRDTVETKICYLRETCDPFVFEEKVDAEMQRIMANQLDEKTEIGFLKWLEGLNKEIKVIKVIAKEFRLRSKLGFKKGNKGFKKMDDKVVKN